MHEKDFTHESSLNFVNLILIHLNKHGLTNHMELRNFFKKIKKLKVTKQAFSQSKEKLKPEAFKNLNNQLLKRFYSSKDVKKFKKHVIISGDGSKSVLPNHKSLGKVFGGIVNKFKELTSVAVNLTTLHDCLNDMTLDLELDKYKTSEQELMYRNMDNILSLEFIKGLKKIFIYDRGFPSLKFFNYLIEENEKFIFRIKKSAYKKEKRGMTTNDEFIDIKLEKNRLNPIKNENLKEKLLKIGKLNLRITKITLESGEEEHLISNLDQETFTYQDLKELYNLRWGIEVSYDVLKNLMRIENVSGYSEIAVKQDYYSQILVYNIVNELKNIAQKIFNQNNYNTTNINNIKKKINFNIVLGIIKEDLIEIMILKSIKLQKKKLLELIEEISKEYTETSTKKQVRKPKSVYSAKFRSNNRNSF
ncbi:MAG: IS4 family transposase [Methanobrevibacter sp.]|jgi:hypothetical protein|nr:IS4 family transposase [Candidatus Methanovirga australis]